LIFVFLMFSTGCGSPLQPEITTPAPIISTEAILPTATFTPDISQPNKTDDPAILESPTQSVEFEASSRRHNYQMDVFVADDLSQLVVKQTAKFFNHTGETLSELKMIVEPNLVSSDFEIQLLNWGNVEGIWIDDYQLDKDTLTIKLPESLLPSESVVIYFIYHYTLPDGEAAFGYSENQATYLNWYPFFPTYENNEGWLINPIHDVGERFVYPLSDYEVTIYFDETVFQVAGPSIGERDKGFVQFSLTNARTFSWTIAKGFFMEFRDGDVPISVFLPTEYSELSPDIFLIIEQSLKVFQHWFGEYPYHAITLTSIDYDDGMESDGIAFIGEKFFEVYDGTPRSILIPLIAHEVAHQWWFGAIGNNQAMEPWVDESFSTYSEYLFYESEFPAYIDWWWEERIDKYQVYGSVNSPIYSFSNNRKYINAVYLKGVQFLHETRENISDDLFFWLLQEYSYAGKNLQVKGDLFFTLLARIDNENSAEIIAKYFND
jgi:hypothetical protein